MLEQHRRGCLYNTDAPAVLEGVSAEFFLRVHMLLHGQSLRSSWLGFCPNGNSGYHSKHSLCSQRQQRCKSRHSLRMCCTAAAGKAVTSKVSSKAKAAPQKATQARRHKAGIITSRDQDQEILSLYKRSLHQGFISSCIERRHILLQALSKAAKLVNLMRLSSVSGKI